MRGARGETRSAPFLVRGPFLGREGENEPIQNPEPAYQNVLNRPIARQFFGDRPSKGSHSGKDITRISYGYRYILIQALKQLLELVQAFFLHQGDSELNELAFI